MVELSGYVYRCSAGETFDKVALNIYDHEKYAADLMNANPGYVRRAVFRGDEVLSLPVVEIPENENENEYAPSTAPWKE
jgi:hypothetical protein